MKRIMFGLLVALLVFAFLTSPTIAGLEKITIKGHLSWQGHGNPGTARWEQYIWVTLDNQYPWNSCITKTNTYGEFFCTFSPLSTPFFIEVHNGHTLSTRLKVLSNSVEVGTLIAGDATQDNKIDKADLDLCEWMIGTKCPVGSSCYFAADINDDQLVTQNDCDLIKSNLGRVGPIGR